MRSLRSTLRSFLRDEHGYDLVEFALATALAGSVASMVFFRGHLPEWTDSATSLMTH